MGNTKTKAIRVTERSYDYLNNISELKPAETLTLIIDMVTNNETIRTLIAGEIVMRLEAVGKAYQENDKVEVIDDWVPNQYGELANMTPEEVDELDRQDQLDRVVTHTPSGI